MRLPHACVPVGWATACCACFYTIYIPHRMIRTYDRYYHQPLWFFLVDAPSSKKFLGEVFICGSWDFASIGDRSLADKWFNFWYVTESVSYLLVPISLLTDLVPLDVEYSTDCAVVEGFQLFFVLCREAPWFAAQEGSVQYQGGVDVMFCSYVGVFVAEKVFSV